MVITLSPAKTLDFNGECLTNKHSNPEFISDSKALVNGLKKITQKEFFLSTGSVQYFPPEAS